MHVKPSERLHERVELPQYELELLEERTPTHALDVLPWPTRRERHYRRMHDPRAQCGTRFGTESTRCESAWTVGLEEYVGAADERAEFRGVGWYVDVELGCAFTA